MAKEFSLSLLSVDHAITINAHSQGTLTVANAAGYGLPIGSHFILKSPAISATRASAAANSIGGSMQYMQPFGDGANLWAGTLNPFRFASGAADLLCGFCIHRGNGL